MGRAHGNWPTHKGKSKRRRAAKAYRIARENRTTQPPNLRTSTELRRPQKESN